MRYNTKYYNRRTKNLFKSRKKNQQRKRKKGKTSKGRRKRKSASRKFRRSRVKKKIMNGGIPHPPPNNIPTGSKVKFIDINSENNPQVEGWIMERLVIEMPSSQQVNDIIYNIRKLEDNEPGRRYNNVKPSNITRLINKPDDRGSIIDVNEEPPGANYNTTKPSRESWWDWLRDNDQPEQWPWELNSTP